MNKILIIDDEQQIRHLLSRMMELEGYETYQAADCKSGMKQLEIQSPEVVLCDVFLPDGNGVELVTAIKKQFPLTEVILLTAHGNIPDGVQAIKNGAFDYITKGDDNNKIIPLISRAMEKAQMNKRVEQLEKQVGKKYSFNSILGNSKAIKDAILLAQKVSQTDVPVLLTGETGTGKEVFAQAIHQNSPRKSRAFVAVNCSAFSKELLESEMFGHKAGSFTGAMKDKKGLFEEANNGTIFLDEIGEMAFDLQAKLLRILESGEYIKIGDTKPTKVNVRVIAATNRNLQQEIADNHFREDLFYRINTIHLEIPPLRERGDDILLFVETFLHRFASKYQRPEMRMHEQTIEKLRSYHWPGNIRELQHAIEKAVILCEGNVIRPKDILVKQTWKPQTTSTVPNLEEVERQAIETAILQNNGNLTAAAEQLGISRQTLYNKLKRFKP